jgi:hypothetical protein
MCASCKCQLGNLNQAFSPEQEQADIQALERTLISEFWCGDR